LDRMPSIGISGPVRAGQPAPLNEIIVINSIVLTGVLRLGYKLEKLDLFQLVNHHSIPCVCTVSVVPPIRVCVRCLFWPSQDNQNWA
jgi:hypothetical protein